MTAGSSALEIAASVRSGERRAAEALDEHLERVPLQEADVHAFNHLTEETARGAEGDVDLRAAAGEGPGALAPLAGGATAPRWGASLRGRCLSPPSRCQVCPASEECQIALPSPSIGVK